jgi:exopolyphosphatase / guanosine-5'-triphosphate,3'-diphosphate pyrophosphatase
MMKQKRLAALDIGTNSIRCIVVDVDKLGKFRVLDDEKATVRLGEGIAKNGLITGAAWQRAIEALVRMKKIVDGYGVMGTEVVATSAVRQAANGEAFVTAVADSVGLQIEIISGEDEAELAAQSALNNFDMEGTRFAMADIGGGSVEIITALGNHIDEIYSLELGAVILTGNFISSDPVRHGEHLKLRKHIRKTLKAALVGEDLPVQCLLGSGGTMTSIAAMVMALRKEGYGSIHGYELLRSEIVHLLAMLLRKDIKERKAIPGLPPDRADIIVAGVTVVDELMGLFKTNLLKINERGIREGLILKGLKKYHLLPAGPQPRNWRDSVLEFARSCHHDEGHSLQVAKLALKIFDAVASSFDLGEKERQMLEAAALVHDVGYFISYSGHHKHTYHLVRHADLFGFTPREREIIAHAARYHRKSLPKKKHDGYARLSSVDRLLVKKLGGILRLADGLDRRRNSQVRGLDCSLSLSTFKVGLEGGSDLSVELFGGKLKGDLFEEAFGRKLLLKVVPTSEQFQSMK